MTSVLMIHLGATVLMAGLILFVQIVHYPLMARVGEKNFERYEAGHTFRTGLLVVPLMIAESISALWLVAVPAAEGDRLLALTGLAFLGVIWLSTALLQAPAHRRLIRGFDAAVHAKLVRTNWIRTLSWLARVPIAFALFL
ncbi:MAG: hypothetical protein HKO65_06390 [Gemmatimonadetes bacterium]|nr:hypothetical protein [Gemmatimonadota bacterium]NNM04716.1 hypothetical protein [Gemmatimonadota bacterium]